MTVHVLHCVCRSLRLINYCVVSFSSLRLELETSTLFCVSCTLWGFFFSSSSFYLLLFFSDDFADPTPPPAKKQKKVEKTEKKRDKGKMSKALSPAKTAGRQNRFLFSSMNFVVIVKNTYTWILFIFFPFSSLLLLFIIVTE